MDVDAVIYAAALCAIPLSGFSLAFSLALLDHERAQMRGRRSMLARVMRWGER